MLGIRAFARDALDLEKYVNSHCRFSFVWESNREVRRRSLPDNQLRVVAAAIQRFCDRFIST
jgi:hypothetical protein